ncbi:MAG: YqaA family protein [Candidatus Levybacteria bacterium]|nr:YqaA family protein [Candidatus Levybacteria bacterium]
MRITNNLSPFLKILLAPNRLLRKAYDWTIHWSKTKYAKPSLFALAFAESSFFPIPPDVLLIAMTVARRHKWWIFASLATVGSVLGGIVGYYIGLGLYEGVGKPIIEFYHLGKFFEVVQERYSENTFLAVFTAAFTPIPFKMFTIAGGIFNVSMAEFIVGAIMGRGGRFFAVALLLRIFGSKISNLIEKYFDIFSLVFMALLIGGFLITKLL